MKKKILVALLVTIFVFLTLEACGYYLSRHSNAATETRKVSARSLLNLRSRNAVLKRQIENLVPKGNYLVIDTAKNRLYVKNGSRTLKEVLVSTGSGSILKDPAGNRQWIFDTPRGERTIRLKKTDPVWTKPDWAFIEEGESVPNNYRDRVEEGVLGDYAFELGDGYMIHGTLYTRLLGRNVTHGCVRVGDKDLKELYSSIPIGTKVIIF
jgi:lipoprotein-anchoring transpeptidase ErfK/SrfK